MQWDAAWKAASEADPNDYEQDPKDYLLTKRLAEEKIIEEGFKQGKTAQEIYAGLDGALYGMPAKKPKDFEIQQALPSIPKRAITQQTRSETDKTGKKQSVTVEIPDPEWVSKIRQVYDNDTKIQELTDRYVTKNTDGTTNYEGIADFWGRYAQKEEITDSKTDVEPREKTVVVNSGGSSKGYNSGGGSKSKKKRAELQYKPMGINLDKAKGIAVTQFYSAEGTLPEKVQNIPIMPLGNSADTKIHTLNNYGEPVEVAGELTKVNNNVQWFPISFWGNFLRRPGGLGTSGGDEEDIAAVVPYALYKDEGQNIYYVPVTAIDNEYEIISPKVARDDAVDFAYKQSGNLQQEDEKEQRVAPKEKATSKEKPKRKLNR